MMQLFTTFIVSFIIWLLVVGPYNPQLGWDVPSVLVGVIVAAIIALFWSHKIYMRGAWHILDIRRYFWALLYLPVLLWEILKANLQVAYIVLHPELPVRPGIVRIKTRLRSQSGIAALADSITLTPGTLSINAEEDGTLYVHWLVVASEDEEVAKQKIIGRFEWLLEKIFE